MIPLLYGADQPGREILHPVAVTIFGGLISATLIDTVLTPLLFLTFGRKPLERIAASRAPGAGALSPTELRSGALMWVIPLRAACSR